MDVLNSFFLKPSFSKISMCLKTKCLLDTVLVFTGFACVLSVELEIGEISYLRYWFIFECSVFCWFRS